MRTICFPLAFFLCVAGVSVAEAQVVSEVAWAGTSLSSSDEWFEIANPTTDTVDITGWRVTSLLSSGQEATIVTFSGSLILEPGEAIVIARNSAVASKLTLEPFIIVSGLTLPNTKLLLKLIDTEGVVRDTVDDGIGNPFAGANPSGGLGRATMERIDLLLPGNTQANWQTASTSSGFDEGAQDFGTPGSILFVGQTSSSSSSSEEIQSSVSSDSSASSVSSSSVQCTDPLQVEIQIQSGTPSGIGKVTINFQAVATQGTLDTDACSWDYGDGFTSKSCNPPTHSFVTAGTYNVNLVATNHCGNTLIQTQKVEVFPDTNASGASGGSSSTAPIFYDGSKLIIKAAFPNPEGTDTGHEWIEIKNMENHPVSLAGWKLRVGVSTYSSYPVTGTIPPGEILRVYSSEQKFSLTNSTSQVTLMTPNGLELSTVEWKTADEGREYYPTDISELSVRGKVNKIIGGTTFDLQLQPEAAQTIGEDHVIVRLIGIKLSDINKTDVISNYIDINEHLRALLKDQEVELEFDTELWDEMGCLRAYAYVYGQLGVQERLLQTGNWVVDTSQDFKKREAYKLLSSSVSVIPDKNENIKELGAQSEDKKDEQIMYKKYEVGAVQISEIYPAPPSGKSVTSGAEWESKEWIELWNASAEPVDLFGWSISIDGKRKGFEKNKIIDQNTLTILMTADLKLQLKNTGAEVSLVSPDGTVIDTTRYPKLKNGQSQSFSMEDEASCLSENPTPNEQNLCAKIVSKNTTAIKKKTTVSKAVKAAAKVNGLASNYQAQLEGDEIVDGRIFIDADQQKLGLTSSILAFILGIGAAASGIFLYSNRKYVLSLKSRMLDLARQVFL